MTTPNLGGKPPYVDSHRTTLNLGRDLADASAKSDASDLGRRVLSGCRPRNAHVDSARRLLSTSSARHSLYNASRVFRRGSPILSASDDVDTGNSEPVGAGNCVVAGHAAFRYSWMSPSQRVDLTTWGWGGGAFAGVSSVACGGR